jgi:hypothetical protein
LFQQFAVDMYIKIEGCRLNWIRDHQTELRADLYKGIVDSITAGETRASAVGTRIVLPWKFQGGFRDMKRAGIWMPWHWYIRMASLTSS